VNASGRFIKLLDPEFYVEPHGDYRWLRDHSPVDRAASP
jgi:hypothetical protein